MDWREEYRQKLTTPEEAVKVVKDGDRVFVGSASSVAGVLADALFDRREEFEHVKILSTLVHRPLKVLSDPGAVGHFTCDTCFYGAQERAAAALGIAQINSTHLSQTESWCNIVKPTVCFLDVSEPDQWGYMCTGPFGSSYFDFMWKQADIVVVQVNKKCPWCYGDSNLIHISDVDRLIEVDEDMPALPGGPGNIDEPTRILSSYILDQIPDGACLQLGIGAVADAVGYGLECKNDLGVHTEMLTDSMVHLAKLGVINGKRKTLLPGKMVMAFALGAKSLYEYIDRNPAVHFSNFSFVNNPYTIAQNDNMISVNTAMAVDLLGQVAADSMGYKQQSGTGGQVDYVRGAQMSKGGKSFIALTSVNESKKTGQRSSRIVPTLPLGTAVTTPRTDVQYVVTEYGCINLKEYGRADRARALIELAHPDFRPELVESAKAAGLF